MMFKAHWSECKPYPVHGEAQEVCILGPAEPEKNVCPEPPRLACSYGMLFFNRAVLAPGRVLEPHAGMTEEIHYILSGAGRFLSGEETFDVAEGDTVYIPAGQTHGITNYGNEDLVYLVTGTTVRPHG